MCVYREGHSDMLLHHPPSVGSSDFLSRISPGLLAGCVCSHSFTFMPHAVPPCRLHSVLDCAGGWLCIGTRRVGACRCEYIPLFSVQLCCLSVSSRQASHRLGVSLGLGHTCACSIYGLLKWIVLRTYPSLICAPLICSSFCSCCCPTPPSLSISCPCVTQLLCARESGWSKHSMT